MTHPPEDGLPTARPRAIELRRLRVPLVEPIRAAHGVETDRRSIIVRATDGDLDGWGECVALERPTYTSEWHDGAWMVLRDMLGPAAVAGADAGVHGHPMASAAVEMATVDLALRAAGRSLGEVLGVETARVSSRAVVGIADTLEGLVSAVAARLERGHRAVKLKIRPGWDHEPVGAVRSTWPELDLAVDANGSYRPDDDALVRLDALGLSYIEQPVAAPDLVGHAALRRRLGTPVALDESASSVPVVEAASALGALDLVNVKPARLGGLGPTVGLHRRMGELGLGGFCGGMYELGLARAVSVAVAAMPGWAQATDLGPSSAYVGRDLTAPFELDADGALRVPDETGIGRTPDPGLLDELTTERVVIGRS